MRPRALPTTCCLCLTALFVPARADVDPKAISLDGKQYDLSGLGSLKTVEDVRDTPPSRTITQFFVSLWSDVPHDGSKSDDDQCPAGSRICAVVTNDREGDKRVTNVVPISSAGPDASTTSASDGDFLLAYAGGSYADVQQRAEIIFRCRGDAGDSSPTLQSYRDGVLRLHWDTPAACPLGSGNAPPQQTERGDKPAGRSVFSIFFWLVVLALVAYFALGAWVNRSQYGASGFDLIPHRDFWTHELPQLVRELFSRGRPSTRAGYSSLG